MTCRCSGACSRPAPDPTSGVEVDEVGDGDEAAELIAADEESASEAQSDEAVTPAPAVSEEAASGGGTDEEKH